MRNGFAILELLVWLMAFAMVLTTISFVFVNTISTSASASGYLERLTNWRELNAYVRKDTESGPGEVEETSEGFMLNGKEYFVKDDAVEREGNEVLKGELEFKINSNYLELEYSEFERVYHVY